MDTILDNKSDDDKLAPDQAEAADTMPKKLDTLPPEEILANLDKQIELLKYQLERLEHLRFALSDIGTMERLGLAMTHTWDEVIEDYQNKLQARATVVTEEPAATPRGPTNFERVAFYFRNSGNEWSTSGDIAKVIRIKTTVLRDILYKTHKDNFERQNNPAGRGKLFRLKDALVR